ncbi:MAG TPA: enoyl-CoA hydratase/isomerase family protein [Thermoanaerobaculia bacterium]|nr:enoyl-CoA hydratase/isomerase family protein [Thermoanaerobaculia bacterium]
MESMIERERRDGILILRLAHGKASALDIELLGAMVEAAREGGRDDSRAIVITGTGTIFSAGVDLKRLLAGGPSYVEEFLPALSLAVLELYRLEKPVIAAINGHAIAGGCVIAAACDYRVMARGGGRIGLPELQVGVVFPPAIMEIVRSAIPRSSQAAAILLGESFTAEQALARGIVDELADEEGALERAVEVARRLAAFPSETVALTKRQMRRPVLAAIAEARREHESEVAAIWKSEAALSRIGAYVERTLAKPR